jgi:hypothetical protein
LELTHRLNIAIDVAHAITYLHEYKGMNSIRCMFFDQTGPMADGGAASRAPFLVCLMSIAGGDTDGGVASLLPRDDDELHDRSYSCGGHGLPCFVAELPHWAEDETERAQRNPAGERKKIRRAEEEDLALQNAPLTLQNAP